MSVKSNWRELLKAQQDELKTDLNTANSGYDQGLNEEKLAEDIDRILRKEHIIPSIVYERSSSRKFPETLQTFASIDRGKTSNSTEFYNDNQNNDDIALESYALNEDDKNSKPSTGPTTSSNLNPVFVEGRPPSASQSRSSSRSKRPTNGNSAPTRRTSTGKALLSASSSALQTTSVGAANGYGLESTPSLILPTDAPEAKSKYQQAKMKILTAQVAEGAEQRRQLSEQVGDLQRQLRTEKEENKKLAKRVQLLEAESKRTSNKREKEGGGSNAANGSGAAAGVNVEALIQELSMLRRDSQAAERLVKQAETDSRAKDAQLKRAAEALSRLKAQVTELQLANKSASGGLSGEESGRTALESAETRVKTLEKQRTELVTAFRKQLRLIDLLKRQKVHLEGMQLLGFTEQEFVRTLDWNL